MHIQTAGASFAACLCVGKTNEKINLSWKKNKIRLHNIITSIMCVFLWERVGGGRVTDRDQQRQKLEHMAFIVELKIKTVY